MLGALSNDKPSAIFRLKATITPEEAASMPGVNAELGISIEPIEAVEQQLQQMRQQPGASNNAMVVAQKQQSPSAQGALQFAERTLQSLFDYAMSFATRPDASMGAFGSGAAVQVLPVKAFEDWYNNFLRKIQRGDL
ncbi:hypothetical protein H4S02_011602 [Coemansia sp. RSA 2611]|nr:hypothetical protein H4S02_011602 [Coemansia sp. RSA 2611]